MAEPEWGGTPFTEAIDFHRQKIDLPTRAWTDLWKGQHARASVVAGAIQANLVADFHAAVTRAIAEGRTLADFRKDFDRIVAARGWSYNGSRGWRSAVIYNTNLRMAHSAGRWAQIQRVRKRRPYLRYSAILDGRTRPEHKAWHGTILPVGHPFWQTAMPPNGFNCRCTVISVGDKDLARRGWSVSDPPDLETETRVLNTPDGKVKTRGVKGIDTGFDYNVGEAGYGRGADLVAQERHGAWEALSAPGGDKPARPGPLASVKPKASLGPRAKDEATLRQALRQAIGGEEAVITDPVGGRVQLGQAIVDHMVADPKRMDGREALFPLIPELIGTPAEIWVGFATSSVSGRVALRRRYVRLFDLGKDRAVGLVADLDGGRWSGITFYRGNARGLANLRSGLRIYTE